MLIGIDWGGTKIEGIALTPDGRELLRVRADTPRHDYHGCIRVIGELISHLERMTGQRGSIGIGIPGSLEPRSRLGKGASSTWLLGRPVEHDLGLALQREIRVENDADCLLETWASGRAFEADYARYTNTELKAAEIVAKLRAGDRLARLVWSRYVDRVARGLSVVVNTLDPDVLVMGGGMSNVDELYRDLPGLLAGYTFSTVLETPIRKAVHGDSSGVRGAAWLWKDG